MNNLKKIILVIAFLFIAGFGIGSSITAPKYATVYIDENTETYLSPPCIPKDATKYMPKVTISDVRQLTLEVSSQCVNQGGFSQEGRSLSGNLLESLGILNPLRKRWNSDGTWNW